MVCIDGSVEEAQTLGVQLEKVCIGREGEGCQYPQGAVTVRCSYSSIVTVSVLSILSLLNATLL